MRWHDVEAVGTGVEEPVFHLIDDALRRPDHRPMAPDAGDPQVELADRQILPRGQIEQKPLSAAPERWPPIQRS